MGFQETFEPSVPRTAPPTTRQLQTPILPSNDLATMPTALGSLTLGEGAENSLRLIQRLPLAANKIESEMFPGDTARPVT